MRETERTEFGARLKAARARAGLSQKELALKAGVSQSNLSELEKSGLGSAKVVALAEACGVSVRWLASGEGGMFDSAGAQQSARQARMASVEELVLQLAAAFAPAHAGARKAAGSLIAAAIESPSDARDLATQAALLAPDDRKQRRAA